MSAINKLRVLCLLAVGLYLQAPALVIVGGDAGHTVAPADDPGWSNVGSVRSPKNDSRAGVVYLCDDWFITTYHAWALDSPTGVVAGATCYTVYTNSLHRLTNSISGLDTNADVAMFRVMQKPALSPLNITSMSPYGLRTPVVSGGNKTIIMIGNGHPREDTPTYWNAEWAVTNQANSVYGGYKFWTGTSKNIQRWGSNQIYAEPGTGRVNFSTTMSSFGDIIIFKTIFNTNAGPDECQIAPIDSGGGVFYKNNGLWELAGLMSTMAQPDGSDPKDSNTNTPGVTWGIADGGFSYIADLSFYRDQIMKTLKPNGWPDLTVVDAAPVTNRANPGASVSIAITTLNQGTVAATNFNTSLYLVPEINPYANTNAVQIIFDRLEAGQSVTNTYTFTAPATPGVYYLVAVADNSLQVHEFYENNNQSAYDVRLLEVGPGPDLTTASTTNEIRITAHRSGSIDFVTRNDGNAAATDFATALFLSPTNTIASMTSAVATHPVSGLLTGQAVTNSYTFKAPGAPGTYYLCAKADASNGITELNETNNWSGIVTLQVTPMAMPWLNLLLE